MRYQPVFWLYYVNDISSVLNHSNTQASLYADDLALCISGRDPATLVVQMKGILDSIASWADQWSVKINVDKCESLLFSTHPQE